MIPRLDGKEKYSVKQAAQYLGLSVSSIRRYIYQIGTLKPDGRFGKSLVFYQETLDKFKEIPRGKAGWPKGKKRSIEKHDDNQNPT